MAEFQKVLEQAKRMCGTFGLDCSGCELCDSDNGVCALAPYGALANIDVIKLAEIERIIMDWAAANPEPRCPTWAEWLRMLGVVRLSDMIPADIAKKLGIKPLGVKDDA